VSTLGRPSSFWAGHRRPVRLVRAAGRLLPLLAMAGLLAGCGTSGGTYSLNPPNAGFMENYGLISPGVSAAYPASLPVSNTPVTLVSAKLLTIPGFPAPKLIHLGVWHIFHGLSAMEEGWPPHGCGGAAPCNAPGARFAGFRLRPGDKQEIVYFWVVPPPNRGDYYVGGLRITYKVGSATYTGDLFSGGEMCVRSNWRKHVASLINTCNFSDKADAELTRMSGQSS
jgi:hypothetical protein